MTTRAPTSRLRGGPTTTTTTKRSKMSRNTGATKARTTKPKARKLKPTTAKTTKPKATTAKTTKPKATTAPATTASATTASSSTEPPRTRHYREALVDLVASLQANPKLVVTKAYIGEPVPRDDISYKLTLEHFELTPSKQLLDFYHALSSCKIEWHCDLDAHPEIARFYPEDTTVSGEIRIRELHAFLKFDDKLDALSWTRNLEDDEAEDLYNFRYLDFNDDYIRVGFIAEENVIGDGALYFLTQDSEGFYPAGLTFDEYFAKLLLYKGFQGWQYNLFFPMTENSKRMAHYLAQLF